MADIIKGWDKNNNISRAVRVDENGFLLTKASTQSFSSFAAVPSSADSTSSSDSTTISRSNRVKKSGSTSAVPSTWTTAIAANPNRKLWRIHNPPTNTNSIDIGYLINGEPVRTLVIKPGAVWEESIPFMDVSIQDIVVRSTGASVPYDAVES